MPAGLPAALVLLAEAAVAVPPQAVPPAATATASAAPLYGPAAPVVPKKPPAKPAAEDCANIQASANTREIVICAQRPQGYRLNPDVLEAQREKKQGLAGRPHNPHEAFRDNSCATVGPMGCRGGAAINLIATALTAAEMAKRLTEGKEIGSMFMTDPHPTEYQLYVEAKKRREAAEAEKAAKAKAAAAAQAKAAQAEQPAKAETTAR
jgi:hypothetical protein